jgi:hypothetical protein
MVGGTYTFNIGASVTVPANYNPITPDTSYTFTVSVPNCLWSLVSPATNN